ncbi:MAG: DUF1080 domain-containing protein [Gammaproteobacteria bacterium]|nr:DUF1080 domain-containing protein [Gammaproteobacteria bacterium]MDH5303528.1 DUF1080 domain-containing protein [Gammaproteobacteria bacterium]MDH5321870.1 DUF1080 domain-containing protein [Gammaproteobacteria bacterium]
MGQVTDSRQCNQAPIDQHITRWRATTLPGAVILLAAVSVAALAQEPAADHWRVLFPGDGLVVDPGSQSEYVQIHDDVVRIFGSTDGGWLRTDRKYADFTIQFEIRFLANDEMYGRSPAANNGLILRSPEVSISGRNWPGRGFEMELWDQVRRGGFAKNGAVLALQPGAPAGKFRFDIGAAQRAYRTTGEWNSVTVIAHGNRIWTKLNGEWLSTAYNVAHPDGHVGFQIEDGITEIRNVRIMEHAKDTWTPNTIVPLFKDGELGELSLADPAYADNMTIHDGLLRLQGSGGWLRTEHMYTSYTLSAEFRFPEGSADSGVFLRAYGDTTDASGWPQNTDEAQILSQRVPPPTGAAGDPRWFGTLLSHGTAGGRASVDTGMVLDAYRGDREWQTVVVDVDGGRVGVTLNGVLVAEGDNVANLESGGYVGLQIGSGVTEFRTIEIHGLRKD